jgi:glycosyltransferase involved in cell wall biosynthesis
MSPFEPLRIAVLVDLPRQNESGGHVKCWERIAHAAAESSLPLDLTVYFSGDGADEVLSPLVRFRHLPPVFSTSRLTFLPYTPDTTDLASWHAALAKELIQYDIIHTTDGFFGFAQTAAKVSRKSGIPLITSLHTDTPAYTRLFTRQVIDTWMADWPKTRQVLLDRFNLPERQGRKMERRLTAHISACAYALTTRPEDHVMAEKILGATRVKPLRLGIDKKMFGRHRADRAALCRELGISPDKVIVLFVGRVDIGKNIYTLVDAVEALVTQGKPLHLIVAGVGPASDDVHRRLGSHVTLPGYVKPDDLARLYASVDALTIASEVEIRSMVGGEALVSGCPVLVSEKSGIAPLFDNTPAMQSVPSGAEAWQKALGDFIDNPMQRGGMRIAALNYAEHFLPDWTQVLKEDLWPVWRQAVEKVDARHQFIQDMAAQ